MDFEAYQRAAWDTDQNKDQHGIDGVKIPILGLAGESGTLLTELKKILRDGTKHPYSPDLFREELGDALWYLTNIASKLDLSLSDVAKQNLDKVRSRWKEGHAGDAMLLDDAFPKEQQFPRQNTFHFVETYDEERGILKVKVTDDFGQVGAKLDDNSYVDDGYRFHDVMHVAHMTVLGWSPLLRGLMDRKRRKPVEVDRVEDGARAIAIEEALTVNIFSHAERNGFFDGVPPSQDVLRQARDLTRALEVKQRSLFLWEKAICDGYRIFRDMQKHRGGSIAVDLQKKTMVFTAPKV